MASLNFNFNWFGDGNFFPKHPHKSPCLAFISSSQNAHFPKNPSTMKNPKSNKLSQKLDQFLEESETRPDFRQFPQVDEALADDPLLERKENPRDEEVEENTEFWKGFDDSPVVQFLRRAEQITDEINRRELRENNRPYRREDKKLWDALPYVPGPDGRPMPRKSLNSKTQSDIRFWDFMRQFLFGLWGFKQRPYPPGRPIDVTQAIGYKQLERRYYDFIMRSGGWFYKDRLGRTRGPLELITLKTAWAGGIIDTNTFIWGEDMDEWAPIGMIYGMEKAIATWEVRLGAAATAFIHKLQRGMNPFTPLKGTEKKTYKELQEEAIESRRRDMAVLEANGGVWPGIRSPSHVHFLWASGSELTKTLEKDHMPNRWIPKEVREALQETFPDLELRPCEILHFEQLMDDLVFQGKWYRPPLSSFTTRPPYIHHFNKDLMRMLKVLQTGMFMLRKRFLNGIPGFDKVLRDLKMQYPSRMARRKKMLDKARYKPEDDPYIYGPRLE